MPKSIFDFFLFNLGIHIQQSLDSLKDDFLQFTELKGNNEQTNQQFKKFDTDVAIEKIVNNKIKVVLNNSKNEKMKKKTKNKFQDGK